MRGSKRCDAFFTTGIEEFSTKKILKNLLCPTVPIVVQLFEMPRRRRGTLNLSDHMRHIGHNRIDVEMHRTNGTPS
jgi:hypothetical protein